MAFIYKITNLINGKIYIGLTTRIVETRWKEHLRGSQEIDNAIVEYGKDNFIIETIEECSEEEVDDREIYWIKYYNSYNDGYNRTLGGRDNTMIMTDNVQQVFDLWNAGLTLNKIQQQTHLNIETIRGYLNKNGVSHKDIRERANIYIGKAKAKPVGQFDKNGQLIHIWESQAEIIRTLKIAKSTLQRAIFKQKLLEDNYWRFV